MRDQGYPADRRQILKMMGGLGAAALAGDQMAFAAEAAKPADVGRKFHPDGRPILFKGNTILCHLPQQGVDAAFFNALLDIWREAPGHSFFKKFTLLPPSSYHVTVFDGANDQARVVDRWPKGLNLDATIDSCHQFLGSRIRATPVNCAIPLRFRIDDNQSQSSDSAFVISLLPYDDTENAKLRALRNQLSDLTGIRAPGHDAYRFHTTIGYPIQLLTAEEAADLQKYKSSLSDQLRRTIPVIKLGIPEYCTYTDMFAFHREFFLTV